jgi:hypothetical protein
MVRPLDLNLSLPISRKLMEVRQNMKLSFTVVYQHLLVIGDARQSPSHAR